MDSTKQNIAKKKNSNYIPKMFIEGEEYLYLGNTYKLRIVKDNPEVFHFNEQFVLSEKWQRRANAIFTHWYKKQAQEIISERVRSFADEYGFKYGNVKITSAKKRWGSCTEKNNLNFPWRLILAPIEIVDSVVVHELVHTKIKNHSREFWNKVYDIMPEYPEYNHWLKKNGFILTLD